MLGRFEFELEHIPRAHNAEADVLSRLSAESPEYISKLATVEELATPSLNRDEVLWVSADPPEWLDKLARYIEDGVAPEDPQEARLLRMRAPTYKVQDGVLYKRSYNGVLLRCLRAAEAKVLMEEIHEGVCAAHQGPYSISRRAIIQGYFWPTMRKDCEEYVRKFPTCQQFQNVPGRPATNYTPISSVIPFSKWGIDIVGALPKGVGQTSSSSTSSSSSSERPATSPPKKPVDAFTCAPSSSVAQVVSVAQPGDEGFIQLDDRLLQEQPSYIQKPQIHELRNLMPDGYQLTYRATWKNIISLHVGTSIGIHYHSIRDLGEFSIHPFKVLFLETYGIMPGQLAPNGHQASTRGLYNVGKWSVYPGRETDPEPEIVLTGAIPDAIPIRRVRGSKAPATATAGPSRPGRKKKEKGALDYPAPQPTIRPAFPLDEQPAQSHQGTSQPIHSRELYINVDTFEFDTLMGETGHTSEAGLGGQPNEDGHGEEEAAEESLQRKKRKAEVINQPAQHVAQSSDAGKGQSQPWSMALMSRSNEELFQAFCADLHEVGQIGHEWFTRLVKSRDEEKARMEAMVVECRKEAKAAVEKAKKAEEKLIEHCAAYRKLYAKHDGLLKAAKEADEQAQAKIQQLEAENARSAEEIARLGDELEKERAERASLAAVWAI
ncbi:unnamed protein product [Cuscuta campestris]|uniref:Integrase zinc-binding domain-containing protein n=1 Tax=Cuscuta campestris TaxID=132261 RepID=A0A484MMM2_9ASTE|nr:unnamed protein product [Cuscuta campestris]